MGPISTRESILSHLSTTQRSRSRPSIIGSPGWQTCSNLLSTTHLVWRIISDSDENFLLFYEDSITLFTPLSKDFKGILTHLVASWFLML